MSDYVKAMDNFETYFACSTEVNSIEMLLGYCLPFQSQFVAVVIHTGVNMLQRDCDFPQGFNVAVFLYAISLIMLFANFFRKTYSRRKTKEQKDGLYVYLSYFCGVCEV